MSLRKQNLDNYEEHKFDEQIEELKDLDDEGCGSIYLAYQKSQQEQDPQNQNIPFIQRIDSIEELDLLPPEERMHYIVNKDTQEIIDSRDENIFRSFINKTHSNLVHLPQQNGWKNYWVESKRKKQQLLDAAETADNQLIIQLLNDTTSYYLNINCKSADAMSPIHYACNEGHLSTLKLLLANNADINIQNSLGQTPLIIASRRGLIDLCQLLLENKANVNATDLQLNTALHYAVCTDNVKLVELLIKSDANPYLRNKQNFQTTDFAKNAYIMKLYQDLGFIKVPSKKNIQKQSNNVLPESNMALGNTRNGNILNLLDRSKSQQSQIDQNDKQQSPQKKKKERSFMQLENQYKIDIKQDQSEEEINPNSFQCYQHLGSGSFGSVFLVEKLDTKQLYAMKVMKKQKFIHSNLMKYAMAEKNVLSLMQHPFIVKLDYAFQTDQSLILVMEYCPGGDLSKLLDENGPLPEPLAKIYVSEIILALEALHQNGIIYRDLKPDNIVLDKDGHALITDFGLSKLGVQDGILNQSFLGSPAYMAPEILNGKGHTRSVDWYLLGVVVYEMLVGVPPYYSDDKTQLYQNIQKGVLRIPKNISAQAINFLVQLLDRNPTTRLGAKKDSEDVKSHQWLSDIDWQQCKERKLTVPKPQVKDISKLVPFPIVQAGISVDKQSPKYVLDWSYQNQLK